MDFVTLGIGIFSVVYGIYIFILRKTSPGKLKKMIAMESKYGNKGRTFHFFFYCLFPILLGSVLIYAGYIGISFFDL